MTIITGDNVQGARLLTLRAGLKLEISGLTRHGRSCYSIIKEEFQLRGNKRSVHAQFTAMLERKGVLV